MNYKNSYSNVCILGLGYIGLPTAALLANRGFNVHGVDIKKEVVETINRGDIHIIEPELDIYVKAAVNSGKLQADLKPTHSDVYIIAVPTPFHEGYIPNIDYVIAAIKSIIPYLKEGNIIILESTSPVGTTEKIAEVIKQNGLNPDKFYIAYCPERVLPGKIMKELVENDRIVGGLNPASTKIVANFYRKFVEGKVLETDSRTAEMCKLVENAFRDVNIAFANEISMICEKLGINIWELIELANHHPRVKILQPGIGVGGHCIAVDPWFIVYSSGELANLIKTAREVNIRKTEWVVNKILEEIKKFQTKKNKLPKIACMGLSYKPDVDDLRESPAVYIVKKLKELKFDILITEPNIKTHKEFELVDYEIAVQKADIIVFLVAHSVFKNIKIDSSKITLDFCGLLQK